jgi:hypothetical protein
MHNLHPIQRLNSMELDFQSLFELLHVYSYTQWLRPRSSLPPFPRVLGSYTRALLVSRDRRHIFVTPHACNVQNWMVVCSLDDVSANGLCSDTGFQRIRVCFDQLVFFIIHRDVQRFRTSDSLGTRPPYGQRASRTWTQRASSGRPQLLSELSGEIMLIFFYSVG